MGYWMIETCLKIFRTIKVELSSHYPSVQCLSSLSSECCKSIHVIPDNITLSCCYLYSKVSKGCTKMWHLISKSGSPHHRRVYNVDYSGDPTNMRSTTRYCDYITWKSKKQDVVFRSSTKSKYKAMTQTTCELIWLRNLLGEIGFTQSNSMNLWGDNDLWGYVLILQTFRCLMKEPKYQTYTSWLLFRSRKVWNNHNSLYSNMKSISQCLYKGVT